jgi:hypothetical protein
MKQPDARKHFIISMVKSGLRIVAGGLLIIGAPILCGVFIIAAELLGVLEELV